MQENSTSDLFGVIANVVSDRQLKTGTKIWILHRSGDAENIQVRGLTKGGRTRAPVGHQLK